MHDLLLHKCKARTLYPIFSKLLHTQVFRHLLFHPIRHNATELRTLFQVLLPATTTFNVKNISGATYTWTYSASVTPSGPTNTPNFTVQRNGSSSGAAWVQVQISTACSGSPATSRVDVTAGAPATPTVPINGVAPYGGVDATVTTDAPPPYNWYVDGNLAKTGNDKRTNTALIPGGTCGVNRLLTVRVANACGSAASGSTPKAYYSYRCNASFVALPNPASSEVTVTAAQTMTTGKAGTAAITEVNIYDQQGLLKKKQKFGQVKRAAVSLNGLSTGIYFIEIVNGI